MPIKGLSEARRLPRLGSIHLGVKITKRRDGSECKPYPSEVDYFVCPPEVQAVFGEKPTSLRIMFPVDNDERFFAQFYKRYTVNLLQCKGDGERADCWAEDGSGLKEIPCPCDFLKTGECKQIGILQFLLPDVPGAGVWQITTSSKNSIIDINSSVAFIRAICGRVNMIPLILKREKREMQRVENGQAKKSTHYTMRIDADEKFTLRQLQQAAQVKPEMVLLPPADESRDDLLYPANGAPHEDTEDGGDNTGLTPTTIEALSSELDQVMADLARAGHKTGKAQRDYIVGLKTEEDFSKAISFFKSKLNEITKE